MAALNASTPDMLNRSESFGESLTKVKTLFEQMGKAVAYELLPPLTTVMNDLLAYGPAIMETLQGIVGTITHWTAALGGVNNILRMVTAGMIALGTVAVLQNLSTIIGAITTLRNIVMSLAFAESLATGGLNLLIGAGVGLAGYGVMSMMSGYTPGSEKGGSGAHNVTYNTTNHINVDAKGHAKVYDAAHEGVNRALEASERRKAAGIAAGALGG